MKLGKVQRSIIVFLQDNGGSAPLAVLLDEFTPEYNNQRAGKKTKITAATKTVIDQLDTKGLTFYKKNSTPDCSVHLTFQGKEFRA